MKPMLSEWSMSGVEDDVRPMLAAAIAAGEPVVLATLAGALRGAPLGVGAQMLFARDEATGFLTGGCVEADVAIHAAEVFEDRRPRHLVYGEGGPADIRLPCGGRIEVLVERIDADDGAARSLLAFDAARRPALWISDGRTRTCLPLSETPRDVASILGDGGGRAAIIEDRILRRFDPVQRLIVIGHDPIALSIARSGLGMGWSTALVRPKGPEAPPPLPGLAYFRADIRHALTSLAPDAWTAVVVATHEREEDGEAVEAAVRSAAGYVGLLGSRSRLPRRLADLRAAGADPGRMAEISAPVGLDIGAITPREIAASIVAEIVQHARAERAVQPSPSATSAVA